MCRPPLHWLMRLVRAAATLGLQRSRRREQHACQRCPPAAHTLVSQFLGIFRRDFCCVLLRVSNRRASPIPFLCPLRLRLLFGIIDGLRKPESPSLYAQGAGIRTARRAYECISSRDNHSRHWFCSMVTHLLLPSAEAPAGKGGRGRVPSSTQRPSAYDAPGWHRHTR